MNLKELKELNETALISLNRYKAEKEEKNTADNGSIKDYYTAKHISTQIEEYNKVARHEVKKDRFGFEANHTDDRPMTEGPWYVVKKVPTIHHTMGGIKINTKAQVIDTKGKVIPGLYAAGEVTGGVHGENRLGGNAIADVMVFGRTAGRNAAAE